MRPDIGQRGQACVAPLGHDLEALGDEGAVHAQQGHHIAHGAERHDVEPVEQAGLGTILVPARLAQGSIDRDDDEKRDADRRQMTVGALLVDPVRVDHGVTARQLRLGDVMVDHDDVEPGLGGCVEGLVGGGAAIDGDDDACALLLELEQRGRVGTVALAHAVGDVDPHPAADGLDEARQQRRRGRPVDVVIAEHGDQFARHDRARQAIRGPFHIDQVEGIGQQVAQGGIEELLALVDADPAGGQHPADDLGQVESLGEREGGAFVVQSGAPATPADRARDAEETVLRFVAHATVTRLRCPASG